MRKILVVDDEPEIRGLVKACLKDEGFEIYEAENAEQALAAARRVGPHLVILDIMMPDKWGFDVCEELKKFPETKNSAVLFLSARDSLPSKRYAEKVGGGDFLGKPFKPQELRDKINTLLDSDETGNEK